MGLKSECILPSCSREPEGQDPVAEDSGGKTAPILEGVIEFAVSCKNFISMFLFRPSVAVFLSWYWPLVALNPRRFCDF